MSKYSFVIGCRGGGRIYYLAKRFGYEKLMAEGIRLKLKYPFWSAADDILSKIQRVIKGG